MAIPFSDSPYIANAKKYNSVPNVSSPANLCQGMRVVPMQFTFQDALTWLVDMTSGSPNPPLSKINSIYIDASLSLHNVFIYFPDTGFVQLCGRGNTLFSPVITAKNFFYIGISPFYFANPYPSDLALPNVDLVNLLACDSFLPGFTNNNTIDAIMSGLPGTNFNPVWKFLPDTQFNANEGISGSTTGSFTIINSSSWFLTGADISFCGNSDNGDMQDLIVTVEDNGQIILTKRIVLNGQLQFYQIFDCNDLNYRSTATGNLTINYSSGTNISGNLSYNMLGGLFI